MFFDTLLRQGQYGFNTLAGQTGKYKQLFNASAETRR